MSATSTAETLDTASDPIVPGIYLGLPEERYFGADALGSTDLKALYVDAESWWWDTNRNSPLFVEETEDDLRKRADARRIGSATHACLLEGVGAYDARFAVAPEKEDYPDALVTIDNLKGRLRELNAPLGGARDVLIQRVRELDPEAQIWDDIVERAMTGRRVMYKREDLRLRLMRRIVENDGPLMEDFNPGLSEVSVFWRDPVTGMLHRARFDRLTLQRPWDLKTFTRRRGVKPDTGAMRRAQDEQWNIQVASYWEAWDQLPELPIYGGSDDERVLMEAIQGRIRSGQCDGKFGWLFCPVNGAPTPLPLRLIRYGLITAEGVTRLREAKENYRAWVRQYGTDTAWVEVAGARDIDDDTEGFGFWRAA